jgi:hypothetical protein
MLDSTAGKKGFAAAGRNLHADSRHTLNIIFISGDTAVAYGNILCLPIILPGFRKIGALL